MKISPADPGRHSSIAYPMEVGATAFAPIPVKEEKDQMLNIARLSAQKEYERIMELVIVLERQAADIKRKLELTDLIHAAEYNFKLYHGQIYWLAEDHNKNRMVLTQLGPNDWSTGSPDHYTYIAHVQYLGGHNWQELNNDTKDIL